MNKLKQFIEDHTWAKNITRVVAFPFWLIYKLITFIMNFSKVIINVCLIILLIGAVVGGIVFAKIKPMYEQASEEAYDKLTNLSADNFHMLSNTVIYDKNGKKIGEINSGSYQYVDIKNISSYIQNGYIATEDKHFKTHAGIDLQSLTRAALALVRHNGEITQGGSTITQQVIKNNLLTQEQSYSRKLTEVWRRSLTRQRSWNSTATVTSMATAVMVSRRLPSFILDVQRRMSHWHRQRCCVEFPTVRISTIRLPAWNLRLRKKSRSLAT